MPFFAELTGTLGAGAGEAGPTRPSIILSMLNGGAAQMKGGATLGIKYVAAGREVYRYAGRTHSISAGQFLLVPQDHGGEVEIGRSDASTAIGLCIAVPAAAAAQAVLDEPLMFPAACSALGRLLSASTREIMRSGPRRAELALSLFGTIAAELEPLVEETARLVDGIAAEKPATRYETLRRLNIARAYLHDVTDRSVELAELAAVAGVSRFQLLRNFRDCFGAPPAACHRRYRLTLAKAALEAGRLSCGEAAHRYGFADGSSFSHAYRRTFGRAPTAR